MTTTDDVARTRELLKAELEEEIRRLITVGATEGALIAVVAYLAGEFPDMTTAELSAAMQDGKTMTDKEGILRMQPSRRWAIIYPGRSPVAIVEGEVFELEVGGRMKLARMERRHRPDGTDEWVTAEGYELRDGMRASSARRPRDADAPG